LLARVIPESKENLTPICTRKVTYNERWTRMKMPKEVLGINTFGRGWDKPDWKDRIIREVTMKNQKGFRKIYNLTRKKHGKIMLRLHYRPIPFQQAQICEDVDSKPTQRSRLFSNQFPGDEAVKNDIKLNLMELR
jgi:hypothetical protein